MAKATEIGISIQENALDLLSPKHSFLATFLLLERKKEDSLWRPYLDILPTEYSTMPVFFSEEDMALLEGSPCLIQIREKIADIRRDYNSIAEAAGEIFSQFTFREFCWARMTASSRIFGITINGVKTDAFVPLADMLNHRRPKQTSWMYDNEFQGFVIEALDDIPKGEQIFDSYGRKCNSRFFMNYGFIVENNDADEVAMQLQFDEDDSLLDMKRELMGREVDERKILRVMADLEESSVSDLFSYLRFIVLRDKSKLLLLQDQKEHNDEDSFPLPFKPKKTPPLSLENEFKMIEKLHSICKRQLSKYPTSFEDDEERIKVVGLGINERNCLRLRMGEKSILKFFLSFCEKVFPLFKLKFKDVRKVIFSPELISCNEYIKKCIMPLMLKEENVK